MGIRRFTENDGPKIKELILSILEKEYPFDRKAYPDTDLDNINETYGGPNETFFITEQDNAIVATAGIKEDSKETALLRRVFVKPEERGKGYGSQLLDEAIRFAKSNGYKELVFRTTSKMVRAIELCKKKGFREAEKIDLGGFFIHKFVLDLNSQV
ncbi:MAG: GNAT family N-acetyltransferase [Candidatus Omnitrophica bacterium]|nr:GNAT family N-acetyltransferase [Candidatus Omnitrophota bacterium]